MPTIGLRCCELAQASFFGTIMYAPVETSCAIVFRVCPANTAWDAMRIQSSNATCEPSYGDAIIVISQWINAGDECDVSDERERANAPESFKRRNRTSSKLSRQKSDQKDNYE
jgi:hypothetical protein